MLGLLGTLIAVGALSLAAAAAHGEQQEPKVVRIDTLNVRDTLYHLSGGGGNALAFIDEDSGGVVLVDTKLSGWSGPIRDALEAVTDLPVTTIINTHAHGDHTGSNVEFPTAVQIVAHENTKANMAWMDAYKGANARFLPDKTFGEKVSLLDGVNRIDLYYFGPAHTNGDTVVVFPAKGVAHVGDLFPSKATPVIDTINGGSASAYPETLARAVAGITGVNRVITGHTPPPSTYAGAGRRLLPSPTPPPRWMTWKDFVEYADFTRDFLAAVRDAIGAGKSVDEAVATLKLPERYKDYGMEHAKANVEAIYKELVK